MSRTRKVIKYSGSLLTVFILCALGIWSFTPVSEEANYKLDRAKNTIQLNAVVASPKHTPAVTSDNKPPVDKALLLDDHIQRIARAAEDAETKKVSEPRATLIEQPIAKTEPVRTQFPIFEEELPILVALDLDTSGAALTDQSEPFEQAKQALHASEFSDKAKAPTPRLASSVESGRIETFNIKSGDTLTRIFSRAGLPISQAIKLSRNKLADQLNRLSIGKTMRIYFDENSQWETLEYETGKLNTLIVSPDKGDFTITQHEKEVEYRIFTARGIIDSTLGVAAENMGVPASITQNLVDVYQWEVDFAKDIRAGDSFSVVYQKAYIDEEVVADGDILAASFHSGGRTIDAIRYTDSAGITGYFQPDGSSLRRSFLHTPVRLARITSGFGKRRHPIKKTWKKHLGVDYGASRGTPILATADGVVQYSGKKGGYGKTVILRHGGIYSTLYAHKSDFGKGIRSGKSITRGQVIGYVGRSGWATGDHLHYEFRVNGQHKDPLKIKLPKTLPLARKEMDTFTDHAEPLIGTLTSLRAAQLATLHTQEIQSAL